MHGHRSISTGIMFQLDLFGPIWTVYLSPLRSKIDQHSKIMRHKEYYKNFEWKKNITWEEDLTVKTIFIFEKEKNEKKIKMQIIYIRE